jgi:chromosome segregation ATPase
LFGKRKPDADARLEALENRARQLESQLRTLENEQIRMHDQVHKWMRRAVAAERNQERGRSLPAPVHVTPAPPRRPASMHGAAARSYARRLEEYTEALRSVGGNARSEDNGDAPVTNGAGEGE